MSVCLTSAATKQPHRSSFNSSVNRGYIFLKLYYFCYCVYEMTFTWQNGRQLASLQTKDNEINYKYDNNGMRTML
jgi:hypothetical protein